MKNRYGVSSWQLVAILISFSLAGFGVLKVKGPILRALLPPDLPGWLWWTFRILIIVPIYEVMLLLIGTLLGQGPFFWSKQKRAIRFLTGRRAS